MPWLAREQVRLGHQVELLSTGPQAQEDRATASPTHIFRRDFPESLCSSRGLREYLQTLACDCIHCHGLWLRTLHYAHKRARQLDVPLIVSPRGMMSDWAWRHRRWRKWLADKLLHPGALASARGWHATSQEEADDIRAHGFSQPICVAPNGVAAPEPDATARAVTRWRELCPEAGARPTALFYSRFHEKKRVLELIDLWAEQPLSDWLLLVVGIPEQYSVAQLRSRVETRSAANRIKIFDGRGEPAPYAAASIFLLPSHSENFGLTIADAMAHGLPVLVTDTTPWSILNENSLGWCVPWTGYALALRTVLAEDRAALHARGERASAWVLREFSWEKSAQILVSFCEGLLENRACRCA